MHAFTFTSTSESVCEGHPDKVSDFIADSILDAYVERDPGSQVACEVLCKDNQVILAGEIASRAEVDRDEVARQAIREIGWTEGRFQASTVEIRQWFGRPEEARCAAGAGDEPGAGDQGIVFGFATRETPELMPLPISLAHRITRALDDARKSGRAPWLRPDGKAQVSVRYENGRPARLSDVVVAAQHAAGIAQEEIRRWITDILLPDCLQPWWRPDVRTFINPAGAFLIGGPEGDCGVTGRKIVADTYGGAARHGGGAFSGKDATKVDRSAAYFARFVARQIVLRGLAEAVEIQAAYCIGRASPVAIQVDTRGTGNPERAARYAARFDFRPEAVMEQLDLRKPIFRRTTQYGHFGKPELEWEK